MLSLAPYSHTPSRLEDFLPWGFLVAPGVILNKDGSFQKSARFRGPDVRSATPEELISFTARANNVFKRLGSGWALYIEAERREIRDYPSGDFADDASRLVDAERAAQFEQAGAQFETIHHITLQWAPPADATRRASAFFFEIDQANDEGEPTKKKDRAERIAAAKAADTRFAKEALDHFERTASWALGLFEGLTVDFHALGDDETLTYLKRTISPKPHKVRAPASAAFLDGLLCDAALVGGAAPVLGGKHLRVLTIKGFPPFTAPGILDDLNALGDFVSLDDALPLPRPHRGGKGIGQMAPALVFQTQIARGAVQGNADQGSSRALQSRCSGQDRGSRCGVAGIGGRS